MPLLKGKSSHGSKPTTSLPLTLSWMPHCCPQKQQCVLTSRSGSTEASTRCPVGYAFSGPNLASSSAVSGGSAAIAPSLLGGPQVSLRQSEHLPPAGGADVLVVAGGVVGPVVTVAQLPLDDDQVVDVDLRRERPLTAGARGLLAFLPDVPVELDRQLGRPLEDVEELAERQPQESENDRDGMGEGEELVAVALEPGVADGQQQAGDADGEEQEQRQEV